MRRELQPLLVLARLYPAEDLPAFLGELEQIRITALSRIAAPAVQSRPDESLAIEQAHKRLGVSKSWLYHNWKKFEGKFARQEGTKVLFSSNGIDAYLRGKSK